MHASLPLAPTTKHAVDASKSGMARYLACIETPLTVDAAFEKLADISRFSEWDPGVLHGRCVKRTAMGVGSIYELLLEAPLGRPVLRYTVDRFERAPRSCVIGFSGAINGLASVDEIRVEEVAGQTRVTYDATLTLGGPVGAWRLSDRLLNVYFRRLGDRAAVGLRRFLAGRTVPVSTASTIGLAS